MGACGGLLRTLNWVIENKKKPADEQEKFVLEITVRNILIGGFAGLFVDNSYVNAFTGGFLGEYILTKGIDHLGDMLKK